MFHGSLVALLTPMYGKNRAIDYVCLRKLVDWHIAQETDAIVVVGTTGEAATLTSKEQTQIIETVVEHADKRIPIIASTGTNTTLKTIARTRTAMKIGVNACLLVTPYYNCPTQEGLYLHFSSIADKIPIPQILYNVPKRTGTDLLPKTIARLSRFTNIIGIKEGRLERAKKIIKQCQGTIDVYSGDDSTALEILQAGGKGVVSVAANLLPRTMHNLCQAAKKNDKKAAKKINQALQILYKNLFIETNPIPVKWLAAEIGLIPTPNLRLPLTTLSSTHQATLKPVLDWLRTQ